MRKLMVIASLFALSLGVASVAHAEQPTAAADQASVQPVSTMETPQLSADVQVQALKAKWAKAKPTPAKPETNWLRKQSPELAQAADASSSWRTVLALLILAGLVTYAWFARHRRGQGVAAPSLGTIRVLGTTRIGPKAQIVVAEIGGQTFLLGVTEQHVTRLAEVGESQPKSRSGRMPDLEADDDPITSSQIPLNGAGRFAEMLKTTLNATPRRRSITASDIATEETDDVVSSRSTLRSSRRPPRWNLDEQASSLFSQSNGK